MSIRGSTLKGYRRYAEHYIKPTLGEKGISKVTTADIQTLYRKLKKRGESMSLPNCDINSLTVPFGASTPCCTLLWEMRCERR